MALEWMVMGSAAAIEAVFLLLLTLPLPNSLARNVVKLMKAALRPLMAVIPFALFQLLDVYWKYEHRITCSGESCTTLERDRFEKSTYKGQRNGLIALCAAFLYWMIYRYVYYSEELARLEFLRCESGSINVKVVDK
ncbi:hypothetical protein AXG93_1040s1030 [Marchantia polymorpha subsp. ruderalis]|uniref:Endoplasmic reticulum transmembrane protein n=1 Tax=Marchantia polymorpha subsp. ruderalis TaxID=1480154 RepID=A0A176VEW6_MARPO|nr:hypothetical protein AXG93_1040s1030 [Marchantia polymorpha subsp. ruderalis]